AAGVEVVTPHTKTKLDTDARGVWLERPGGERERVGFAFVYDDCDDVPAALRDAMLAGKVASNYTPGVDFVGDKQFKGYVDRLTRFYLGEAPLLRSVPVRTFLRDGALDADKVARLFAKARYRRFVFKPVDGLGGAGV